MKKNLLFLLLFLNHILTSGQVPSRFIIVDQFGYLPDSKKIAVIRDPQTGFDADESFTPGSTYSLVNSLSGEIVFSASPVVWKSGTTDPSSGDKVWTFNFSTITQKGRYYILDAEKNLKSFDFEISPVVYREVLKQAVRFFFYQRVGFAKESQYAGIGWADGASHIGPLQDKNCRLFSDKNNAATERDLSGGWYDAGDYNKYTSWTANYVVEMMKAYSENPFAWGDDYNIPESGNNIPDLLDEAKWGLDFLLRMQQPNGASLCIVSESHASPPSAATGPSLYGPATSSATLNSCAAFAISSGIYRSLGLVSYADTLLARAKDAWKWAEANPAVIFNNNDAANSSLGVGAGNQEEDAYTRSMSKLEAACFLFEQTNDAVYKNYFDSNYLSAHLFSYNFAYPFETANQEILLYYSRLQNATASIASGIRNKYKSTMLSGTENFPAYFGNKDPYGAHIDSYTWGSNSVKCSQGNMFYDLLSFAVDSSNMKDAIDASQAYIHYIHGVNPLNMVYLSNMYNYGGDNCVNEFYHSWFTNGSSKWDRVGTSTFGPPPGFLTGGPNPSYNWASCCPDGCGSAGNNAVCLSESISPPKNQPKQKSYKDFNTSWPLNSWEVTENSCGYQVNYIRLLSKFVDVRSDCNGDINGTASPDACGICSGGNTGRVAETDPCNCSDSKLPTILNVNECSVYTSPSGKYSWTKSGTYNDTILSKRGCDSLLLIHLSIGSNSTSTLSITACGEYMSPGGKVWTVSGSYTDTIPNYSGCDSIIFIDLKVGVNSKSTIYPVACSSYTSPGGTKVWTNSGIYTDTIPNANGCDSVITVKLTVKKISVTLSQSGVMLTASSSGGTYRWFRCGSPATLIENAVNRTYTPPSTGDYAVEYTQNGCIDTSDCYLFTSTGLDQKTPGSMIKVFPNPTSGKIKITLPETESVLDIELKNALGQSFQKEVFYQKRELELSFSAPAGLYFLVVRNSDKQQYVCKLVIK
jgi:hypothetical protein